MNPEGDNSFSSTAKLVTLSKIIFVFLLIAILASFSLIAVLLFKRATNSRTTDTTNKTETPRIFTKPENISGIIQPTPKTQGGSFNFRTIGGTVEYFDGTTIGVSLNGSSYFVELWENSNEIVVSRNGKLEVVKKGDLKLNSGDYISYEVSGRMLSITPK